MTFKNEKIYDGMKELVKKALAILDRSGVEYGEDLNIDVENNNIPPISFLLNNKIWDQIYSKKEAIEKTHEFAHACDLVTKIPKIPPDSRLKNSYEIELGFEPLSSEEEKALRRQQFESHDLPIFLNAYCNLKRDLKFDEATFNGLYKRFEERLCGKKYTMALCPLKKFHLETDELVLDNEIKIRRISQEELSVINKYISGDTLKAVANIQFTIEYTYDENKFRNLEDVDEGYYGAYKKATAFCEKKFIEIVALLRLFKDGDFHNPLEFFQVPVWDNDGQCIYYNVCDRWIPEDRNYILKRDETEDFTEFYKKSLRFSDDRRMFIALERFNLAYEKKRLEDHIIDYVIAFEALFGTMQNHIGMEIGLKSGFLIGGSKEKINEIYKFMRDVYKLRSRIVHGGEITFPMKIGENDCYSDYLLKKAIIKLFRKIIVSFFDEKKINAKKEVFAIIEDKLKPQSGEQNIESILDKMKESKNQNAKTN